MTKLTYEQAAKLEDLIALGQDALEMMETI